MPKYPELHEAGTGSLENAAKFVEALVIDKLMCDPNYKFNTDAAGGAPTRVAKVIATIPQVQLRFAKYFNGELLENGNVIQETHALIDKPLWERDRFENADKLQDQAWLPASFCYKPNPDETAHYYKATVDANDFSLHDASDGALTKFAHYNTQIAGKIYRAKEIYEDRLKLRMIGSYLKKVLAVMDPNDKKLIDLTKDLNPLVIIENVKYRNYLKDEQNNIYAVLIPIKANEFNTIQEAIESGKLAKMKLITKVDRPGKGADEDEKHQNTEIFYQVMGELLEDFQEPESGRSLAGNMVGNTGITKVLIIKNHIMPYVDHRFRPNIFHNEGFNMPYPVITVPNFGYLDIDDKVYGFIVDVNSLALHPTSFRTGVDVNHEKGIANTTLHVNYMAFESVFMAVHVLMDKPEVLKGKNKKN